ncbi:MAG TPA: hypothetical protein VLF60_01185 [Candidatus Saccharimonadales bacterium]|nr:hypothetical protein [Candidatus Saccharimonadales bacterium]
MNSYRPFITFIIVVLIVAAGFWGVLSFASHYNHRLASPQPVAQKQPSSSQAPPSNNNQPTPKPKATPSQPSPKATPTPAPTPTPSPSSSAPVAQANPTHVPSTGLESKNLVFASILISMSAFLLLQLRRQNATLRLNR